MGELDADATLPATSPPPRASGESRLAPVELSRYELGPEIARGGMGRILSARDVRHRRPVAIKELIAGDERRFEREALITAALQHPAIVPVYEAGCWPDGSPFYAMKLVDGEPLDKVVKARPTLDARLALVPNVIAVADALAYAHGQRVIHRDLKPANVLVGKFGETYVIDWGLAKRLDEVDDDAPSLSRARTPAPDLTAIGDVIGTPLYMAPEQAAGDDVDARADVYALGAMLYHVLAGVPPYEPAHFEVMIARVASERPVPLGARVKGIPRELLAIVDKAMARDRERRYADAGALVDELRRFQTGQLVHAHRYNPAERARRFVRRNRVSTAVVAVAVAAAVAFVPPWLDARSRAQAEQASAADLVAAMLAMEQHLERADQLDALVEVSATVIARLAPRTDRSEEDERSLGIAFRLLGRATTRRGNRPAAVGFLETATWRLARARAAAPDDSLAASNEVKAWSDLAEADMDSLRAELGEARRACTLADALDPRSSLAAEAHVRAAQAEIDNGFEAMAHADLEQASAVPRAKLDLDIQIRLASVRARVAYLSGRAGEAETDYITVVELVNGADGLDVDALAQRASAEDYLSDLSHRMGDDAGAREHSNASIAAYGVLHTLFPSDRDRTVAMIATYLTSARLGDERAWADLMSARMLAREIARPETDGEVARMAGLIDARDNKLDAAIADFTAAVDAYKRAAARGVRSDFTELTAWSLENLGDALLAKGDVAGAAARFDEQLAISSRQAADNPKSRKFQADLADADRNVAKVLRKRGDVAGADAKLADAIAIRRRLAAVDPQDEDNLAALDKLLR